MKRSGVRIDVVARVAREHRGAPRQGVDGPLKACRVGAGILRVGLEALAPRVAKRCAGSRPGADGGGGCSHGGAALAPELLGRLGHAARDESDVAEALLEVRPELGAVERGPGVTPEVAPRVCEAALEHVAYDVVDHLAQAREEPAPRVGLVGRRTAQRFLKVGQSLRPLASILVDAELGERHLRVAEADEGAVDRGKGVRPGGGGRGGDDGVRQGGRARAADGVGHQCPTLLAILFCSSPRDWTRLVVSWTVVSRCDMSDWMLTSCSSAPEFNSALALFRVLMKPVISWELIWPSPKSPTACAGYPA